MPWPAIILLLGSALYLVPKAAHRGAGNQIRGSLGIRWDVGIFAISVSRQGFSLRTPPVELMRAFASAPSQSGL